MRGRSEKKSFVRVRMELLWRDIYCANTRPEPDFQSVSLSCKGLGRQDTWIIREYDLATVIAIRKSTQMRACEMGSSIFVATSPLKFASMTRTSFTSMPSKEITNGKMFFHCSWKCLTWLSFFLFPTKPGAFSLALSCRCHSLSNPLWRQWWI